MFPRCNPLVFLLLFARTSGEAVALSSDAAPFFRDPAALASVSHQFWAFALAPPTVVLWAVFSMAFVGLVVAGVFYQIRRRQPQLEFGSDLSDPPLAIGAGKGLPDPVWPHGDSNGCGSWNFRFASACCPDCAAGRVVRRGSGVDLPMLASLPHDVSAEAGMLPRRHIPRHVTFVEQRNVVVLLPSDEQPTPVIEMISWFFPPSAGENYGTRDGLLVV